jgi:hypothetical protein
MRVLLPFARGFVQRDGCNSGLAHAPLGFAHREHAMKFLTREHAMMKFYCLVAAAAVCFPAAFAVANQAAMIVA